MATITGQRASSPLPRRDTPRGANAFPPRPDGLSHAEIARAVPAGSRRIRSQREALRGGLSCPDLAGVRADFREHLTAWWRIHVNHASWGGEGRPPRGTTEPTRARTCELGGMSITTYKRCSRWWRARGYIAVVRQGWTPMLRPGALASPDDHNERQVLVLCLPRRRGKPAAPAPASVPAVSGPLSGSRREPDKAPRAREANPEDKPGKARAPRGQPMLPRSGPAPLGTVPEIAARHWRRLRRCKNAPACCAGCPVSTSGTWPGLSSPQAGRRRTSCTRSTTTRAAASAATRPGSAPPPGGSGRAWPPGSARTAPRCRHGASS